MKLLKAMGISLGILGGFALFLFSLFIFIETFGLDIYAMIWGLVAFLYFTWLAYKSLR